MHGLGAVQADGALLEDVLQELGPLRQAEDKRKGHRHVGPTRVAGSAKMSLPADLLPERTPEDMYEEIKHYGYKCVLLLLKL